MRRRATSDHHFPNAPRRTGAALVRMMAGGLLLAGTLSAAPAQGQDPSPLARVEALGLDTMKVGRVTVYFASADRERAGQLASLCEAAAAFFERELGIAFDVRIAALGPEHWFSEHPGIPYAIPWASIPERLIFMPSSLKEGFLVQGPSELEDRRRADFILLHEYGHLAAKAYFRPADDRNDLPVSWFDELLANYFAYAYLHVSDGEWAEAAKATWVGVIESFTPSVLSLDWGFMNDLPPDEIARTYGWYQNLLNLRAAAVYEEHGLDFLRMLKNRLVWEKAAGWNTASLLPSLEDIAPGFEAWARDLKSGDYLPRNRH